MKIKVYSYFDMNCGIYHTIYCKNKKQASIIISNILKINKNKLTKEFLRKIK
jgi:hypothetical protein